MLLKIRQLPYDKTELRAALSGKAEERGTSTNLNNWQKYIQDIRDSKDLELIWNSYTKQYTYAEGIEFLEIVDCLENLLKNL